MITMAKCCYCMQDVSDWPYSNFAAERCKYKSQLWFIEKYRIKILKLICCYREVQTETSSLIYSKHLMLVKALLHYNDKNRRILILHAGCIKLMLLKFCCKKETTQISPMVYRKKLHCLIYFTIMMKVVEYSYWMDVSV